MKLLTRKIPRDSKEYATYFQSYDPEKTSTVVIDGTEWIVDFHHRSEPDIIISRIEFESADVEINMAIADQAAIACLAASMANAWNVPLDKEVAMAYRAGLLMAEERCRIIRQMNDECSLAVINGGS